MKWQIRIQDPSGETRIIPIQGSTTIGRSEKADIILRDPTAPKDAAVIWPVSSAAEGNARHLFSPFWIKTAEGAPPASLGDIPVNEAHLPEGMAVRFSDTILKLESCDAHESTPLQPHGAKPWLTLSAEGKQLLWTAKKAASTPLSIYVGGETGTGKEVLANLIHAWSSRKSGPFVPLHCGALPLSLAESELFGHVKGAFTGASNHRPGALMQAHGGTLFLDEIGDLPLDIQVKLLRFLENGEIRPVGADNMSHADVRLVCATHHPLEKLVDEGKFRKDLFYRIASVTLEIPPLRTRHNDIRMLAIRFASDLGKSISPKAILRLQAHAWPGNVRELRHAVERASGLAGDFKNLLDEESFEFLLNPKNMLEMPQIGLGAPILKLAEMERVLLLKALRLADGNRTNAAKILGVARSTLFEMLKRYKIQGPKSGLGNKPLAT